MNKHIKILKQLIALMLVSVFTVFPFSVHAVKSEQVTSSDVSETNTSFESAVANLAVKSFSKKKSAVIALAKFENEKLLDIFEIMLAGKLYYIKESKIIVAISKQDKGYQAINILTGNTEGTFSKRKLKKISVNNSLRRMLRTHIAELKIRSPQSKVRRAAVEQLLKSIDENSVTLLYKLLENEQDEAVKDLARVGIALWNINAEDKQLKLKSIAILSDSLLPQAKAQLQTLYDDTEDSELKAAANKALKSIEEAANFYAVLENVVFGLSLGSVLLLIAIGLSITFGVMGVINMAHGELMMLGAYTTFVVQQMMPDYITTSIFISIPLAFCVSGFFGVLIERFVIRYLYGRPLETLLATFGISLILQQFVRTIFGPTNQAVVTPAFMSGSLEINSIFAITYNRLYIFIFALIVFGILLLILKKTRLGLEVRAVSQNRSMAKAMGVRTEWVDAMTFGLGSGVAGVAGVALSQLTNVGPNLGQGYIIDSFMVVVFGGVGNLWGTLVAGLSLGVINKFLEPWTGAVLAKILVLVFIILFIQKRPRGLFPQKGRGSGS